MPSNWAEENLTVIRTLMERAAIYRRALGPSCLTTGILGCVAALLGYGLGLTSLSGFSLFWLGVSLISIVAAFLIVRRQALRDAELFWSPPTRRVTQAMLPTLTFGLLLGVVVALFPSADPWLGWWLPPIWMALYGGALHAAGFFMPRGIKLFGWVFVVLACLLLLGTASLSQAGSLPPLRQAHWLMGAGFGGLHVAYGLYLLFTEKEKNET